MNSDEQGYLILTALQFLASRTRRVSMLRTVRLLVGVFVFENYRFEDIMQGFADHAKDERDRHERLHEEDKQRAWENVEILLKAVVQEADGEGL